VRNSYFLSLSSCIKTTLYTSEWVSRKWKNFHTFFSFSLIFIHSVHILNMNLHFLNCFILTYPCCMLTHSLFACSTRIRCLYSLTSGLTKLTLHIWIILPWILQRKFAGVFVYEYVKTVKLNWFLKHFNSCWFSDEIKQLNRWMIIYIHKWLLVERKIYFRKFPLLASL
jgi:hypothetical protein